MSSLNLSSAFSELFNYKISDVGDCDFVRNFNQQNSVFGAKLLRFLVSVFLVVKRLFSVRVESRDVLVMLTTVVLDR